MKTSTYLFFILLLGVVSCNNIPINEGSYSFKITELRQKKNKEFLGANSPIPKHEKGQFVGLNYFPIDSIWKIKADFVPVFGRATINMKTNTERSPRYLPFAELKFSVNEQTLVLVAYKSLDNNSKELFIPFTDLSNGIESYNSGRYLDLEIPSKDSVFIDFNQAYNPYCAYNKQFSCPIPPQENALSIKVLAGERKYH